MEKEHDLAKWLAGEMSETERNAFEQSPGFATYEKIARLSQSLETSDFDREAMYQNVVARPKQQPKVVRLDSMAWVYRVAAILVVGMGIWWAWPAKETKMVAQAGKTQIFSLPDASQVTLNSGSDAAYTAADWPDHRKISLHGEAFFKVAKGKTFDVITEQGTVTVVGTQFNVKSRGERFEVTCYEGKVRVQCGTNTTLITRGQKVAFDQKRAIPSNFMDSGRPMWMDQQIEFTAEPLNGVVAELERTYNIKIDVAHNASGKTQAFTGVMPADKLEVALQIVSKTFALHVTKTGAAIMLSGE